MAALRDTTLYFNVPNTLHYVSEKFWFALKDTSYPNWNGFIANMNVNLGPGSFR